MDKLHAPYRYHTPPLEVDREGGSTNIKLVRSGEDGACAVAEIVFWDATGQFSISAFDELPMEILELFMSEARDSIRIS